MTSKRRSSVAGFYQISIQQAKLKDGLVDIIDYRKLKEEPLSDDEYLKGESNDITRKTKVQENVLDKATAGRIPKGGILKQGTNFEKTDTNSICSDDSLKDFTSDVAYKSTFENFSNSKDEADKKKLKINHSAQVSAKNENESSQPHSKPSKSKLREDDASKYKRVNKHKSHQKVIKNKINEVVSITTESKNNILLEEGHLENSPVEEGNIEISKSESILGNNIKNKVKNVDINSGSKANLHASKSATKAAKFETKPKKENKKLHKEMKNGDSSEDKNLGEETKMSEGLRNVRRSKRIAGLTKVCYKEISLFKQK